MDIFNKIKTGTIKIQDKTTSLCIECKGYCCESCSDGFFVGYVGFKWARHFNPHLSKQIFNYLSILQFKKGKPISEKIINQFLLIIRKKWGNSVTWNNTNGFLTSTGCSIPREFRSNTCRNFLCYDKSKPVSSYNSPPAEAVRNKWHKQRLNRGLDTV